MERLTAEIPRKTWERWRRTGVPAYRLENLRRTPVDDGQPRRRATDQGPVADAIALITEAFSEANCDQARALVELLHAALTLVKAGVKVPPAGEV